MVQNAPGGFIIEAPGASVSASYQEGGHAEKPSILKLALTRGMEGHIIEQ
jgi:hypothetical protein